MNNKKTKQWFNENCKKAIQERDKAKSLVVIESSIENKRRLAQKQKRMKRIIEEKKESRKINGSKRWKNLTKILKSFLEKLTK